MLSSPVWAVEDEPVSQEPVINKLIREKVGKGARIEGEELKTGPLLKYFYKERENEPLWSRKGKLKKQAKEFVYFINKVEEEGLNPTDYHAISLDKIVKPEDKEKNKFDESTLADLDLLLTDAFFAMAYHFSHGFINPYNMSVRW